MRRTLIKGGSLATLITGLVIINGIFISASCTSDLEVAFFSLILLLEIFLVVKYFLKLFNRRYPKPVKHQNISKSMLKHYQLIGLSDDEVQLFRKTMQEAKSNIQHLEATTQASPQLKAIALKHRTINISQAYFKALVSEPKRLIEADSFLYKHLPNLVHLSQKYLEINQHEVKTTATYEVLEKSLKSINDLSSEIANDYTKFVADDIDDLKQQINAANQTIQKEPANDGTNTRN